MRIAVCNNHYTTSVRCHSARHTVPSVCFTFFPYILVWQSFENDTTHFWLGFLWIYHLFFRVLWIEYVALHNNLALRFDINVWMNTLARHDTPLIGILMNLLRFLPCTLNWFCDFELRPGVKICCPCRSEHLSMVCCTVQNRLGCYHCYFSHWNDLVGALIPRECAFVVSPSVYHNIVVLRPWHRPNNFQLAQM
jgi:hypothetical protein